jgi:hypothetical protein
VKHLSLSLVLLLMTAGAPLAQTVSSTTGAIDGIVRDTSEATLPGVTVTITSPAMMGARESLTNEAGTFRFVSITPGVYEVTFALQGFATVRRTEVRVGAGFTATLNVVMQVAALEESVIVSGASPMVDTQATSVQTTFDAARIALLPNASNDPFAMMAAVPAVKMSRIDVGGSAAGTQTGFVAYGTGGQRPYYEGINGTTDGGTGVNYSEANGNYVDMYAFDEVAVNTIGNNAEMGPPGVMMVFVAKSGGNAYHGTAGLNYSNDSWQSYNIDAEQEAAGVTGGGGLEARDTNRLHRFMDNYAQLGGYLKKDKLWWFGAYRYTENQIRQTNFPVKPFKTQLAVYQGKATYQLTPNNKVIGYYMWNSKQQPNRLDRFQLSATNSIHLDDRSQAHQEYTPRIWKVEYNSVLNNALFFEVRAGQWGYLWTDSNELGVGTPTYEDLGSRVVSGAARHRYLKPRRNQVLGSLSYFKQGWGGSHNFKGGWEVFRQTSTNGEYADSYNGVVHILRNAAPLEVYLLGNPSENEAGLMNTGAYLTDTWRTSNKITLNLGLRFDQYLTFLPAQRHEANSVFPETVEFEEVKRQRVWNLFAPRIGISYDITGDGRTVIKGNWGLYWHNPGTGAGNPNATWQKQYAWADLNGDREWQAGEEGRLISVSGGQATVSLDPNYKDAYTLDTSVWLERELVANLAVRTGFVHRTQNRPAASINLNQPYDAFNVPRPVLDPGPDGVVGSGDDGPLIEAWNLQANYVGLPTEAFVTHFGNDSRYDTFELTLNKRMSNRWAASTSYSFTKSFIARPGLNPNGCIQANARCQDETTDYNFKLNGSFELPAGFRLSPVFRFQAGNNYARTFVASLNYANPTIQAEPMNSNRLRSISVLDIRVERGFTILGRRISPFFDVYNLMNSNAEQNITVTSGTSWLRPINIMPPRVARIGARFDW